jgi:hypothetical protein
MRDLIGRECACDFALPSTDWPIPGYPAWVIVVDVDMPMVLLKSRHGGDAIWISASIIKTLRPVSRRKEPGRRHWYELTMPQLIARIFPPK